MASFGHVAVGLLAGRLHGGSPKRPPGRRGWIALLAFAGLALLPDIDVLLVVCGAPDASVIGHRGASHSLIAALAIGLFVGVVVGLSTRRLGWPPLRTALVATLAVASHGLLDALAQGGRGLPLLWPLTDARFHAPWRIIPDAPRGLHLVTQHGLAELAIEFVIFSPITLYALWPQLALRLRQRPQPSLTVISGGARAAVPRTAPSVAPSGALATDRDPSLRSSG